MGFTAAASWAQAYNEAKAAEVSLPACARLVDSKPPPTSFPIWGSILDDVWAIGECDAADDPPGLAHDWMQDMATAWGKDGVVEHVKKAVSGVHKEEVQGVMVDGLEGWLGVSRVKRARLFQAGMYLLAQRRPLVGEVDRWLGKLSFALSFRPCARSILQDIYTWLSRHRGICKRAELWPSVRAEIVMSVILIPFMQSDLRAQWCKRVEASDAAPGGHGRAWTQMSEDLVAEASRLCCHKGVYTNLQSEYGISLDQKGECPMQQVSMPLHNYKWSTAARKGGYKHITVEEAIALNWSLHVRWASESFTWWIQLQQQGLIRKGDLLLVNSMVVVDKLVLLFVLLVLIHILLGYPLTRIQQMNPAPDMAFELSSAGLCSLNHQRWFQWFLSPLRRLSM